MSIRDHIEELFLNMDETAVLLDWFDDAIIGTIEMMMANPMWSIRIASA